MSKRADLKARIHTLGEIKSIISAMKNLSIIEMNKVSRFLGAQNELTLTIQETLGDYERFFDGHEGGEGQEMLYILLGSERGFCGGFNEAIIKRFMGIALKIKRPAKVITIGRKLASKLVSDSELVEVVAALDGPSAAEEIGGSITELVRCLTRFPKLRWTLIHHESADTSGNIMVICPFNPVPNSRTRDELFAPLLNIPPKDLYPLLFEQYLFSVLYRAYYLSFLAENRDRLRHMDGALSNLEKNWNQMRRMNNVLRQEEITEELEVIMLSAAE